MSRFLNYGGRTILTVFVAVLFLFLLGAVLRIRAAFHSSQNLLSHVALHIGTPSAAGSDSDVQGFWPDFPHTGARNIQRTIINGTAILTEDWETDASAAIVLSFYRDQMIARGWQDTTEQRYEPQLGPQDMATIENSPQGQESADQRQRMMDSTLVLSRQDRTMQISAGPGRRNAGSTAVKILAAEAPSMQNFFDGVQAAFAPKAGQARQPMDAVQHDAGQTYHTTIEPSDEAPAGAFERKLAALASQRWQRARIPSKPGRPSGYFAWMARGRQYGILSVTASDQGGGSSVTFMEVSPDGRR